MVFLNFFLFVQFCTPSGSVSRYQRNLGEMLTLCLRKLLYRAHTLVEGVANSTNEIDLELTSTTYVSFLTFDLLLF